MKKGQIALKAKKPPVIESPKSSFDEERLELIQTPVSRLQLMQNTSDLKKFRQEILEKKMEAFHRWKEATFFAFIEPEKIFDEVAIKNAALELKAQELAENERLAILGKYFNLFHKNTLKERAASRTENNKKLWALFMYRATLEKKRMVLNAWLRKTRGKTKGKPEKEENELNETSQKERGALQIFHAFKEGILKRKFASFSLVLKYSKTKAQVSPFLFSFVSRMLNKQKHFAFSKIFGFSGSSGDSLAPARNLFLAFHSIYRRRLYLVFFTFSGLSSKQKEPVIDPEIIREQEETIQMKEEQIKELIQLEKKTRAVGLGAARLLAALQCSIQSKLLFGLFKLKTMMEFEFSEKREEEKEGRKARGANALSRLFRKKKKESLLTLASETKKESETEAEREMLFFDPRISVIKKWYQNVVKIKRDALFLLAFRPIHVLLIRSKLSSPLSLKPFSNAVVLVQKKMKKSKESAFFAIKGHLHRERIADFSRSKTHKATGLSSLTKIFVRRMTMRARFAFMKLVLCHSETPCVECQIKEMNDRMLAGMKHLDKTKKAVFNGWKTTSKQISRQKILLKGMASRFFFLKLATLKLLGNHFRSILKEKSREDARREKKERDFRICVSLWTAWYRETKAAFDKIYRKPRTIDPAFTDRKMVSDKKNSYSSIRKDPVEYFGDFNESEEEQEKSHSTSSKNQTIVEKAQHIKEQIMKVNEAKGKPKDLKTKEVERETLRNSSVEIRGNFKEAQREAREPAKKAKKVERNLSRELDSIKEEKSPKEIRNQKNDSKILMELEEVQSEKNKRNEMKSETVSYRNESKMPGKIKGKAMETFEVDREKNENKKPNSTLQKGENDANSPKRKENPKKQEKTGDRSDLLYSHKSKSQENIIKVSPRFGTDSDNEEISPDGKKKNTPEFRRNKQSEGNSKNNGYVKMSLDGNDLDAEEELDELKMSFFSGSITYLKPDDSQRANETYSRGERGKGKEKQKEAESVRADQAFGNLKEQTQRENEKGGKAKEEKERERGTSKREAENKINKSNQIKEDSEGESEEEVFLPPQKGLPGKIITRKESPQKNERENPSESSIKGGKISGKLEGKTEQRQNGKENPKKLSNDPKRKEEAKGKEDSRIKQDPVLQQDMKGKEDSRSKKDQKMKEESMSKGDTRRKDSFGQNEDSRSKEPKKEALAPQDQENKRKNTRPNEKQSKLPEEKQKSRNLKEIMEQRIAIAMIVGKISNAVTKQVHASFDLMRESKNLEKLKVVMRSSNKWGQKTFANK